MNKGLLFGMAVLVMSAPSFGQNVTEQQFVDGAAQSNMMEAHLGKMAQQQAMSNDVKQYGRMIEADHQNAYQKLAGVATGTMVPKGIDAEHQQKIDSLKGLTGESFDRQFREAMIASHEKAIDLFQRAGSQLGNQQLKEFANQQLPALRSHLEQAKQLGSSNTISQQSTTSQQNTTGQQRDTTGTLGAATAGAATSGAAADAQRARSVGSEDGTNASRMAGDNRSVHHGTVTRYESGKSIELKMRDRVGTHKYDISEGMLSAPLPANLAVDSKVIVSETIDQNGRRAIRIEMEDSKVGERSVQ